MRPLTRAVLTTAASTALAGTAYRIVRARRSADAPTGTGRRHVITVYRPLDDLTSSLPGPLIAAGDKVEVQFRSAPAGRGTEISVRALDDSVSDADLRRLLRESRSLAEVGDVLQPGGPTTTPTVLNKALRSVTRRGREGGLL